MTETAVLQSADPRGAALERDGWRLVGEFWGARLRLGEPPTLDRLHTAVEHARVRGFAIEELGVAAVTELAALEAATHQDYPQLPATPHPLHDEDALRSMVDEGCRAFGARWAGALVAATVVRPGSVVETEFTSVLPAYRRLGLATAVKAASVLALAADGHRTFGTGGAGSNVGSLRMNTAIGYVVEETWLSYERPGFRAGQRRGATRDRSSSHLATWSAGSCQTYSFFSFAPSLWKGPVR